MAYFERLANNVLRFRGQYAKILDDIKNQGLHAFVPQEYGKISSQILKLDQLLADNEVESARDLSLEIGQTIHGLFSLARNEKSRFERKERQQRKEDEERTRAEIQQQANLSFIEQMKQNLVADKESNPEAVEKAVQKLESLKSKAGCMSASELQERLVTESDKVDGEIADETVRREVIKAIYQSLRETGFIVSSPLLSGEVVVLKAQKPAGQQAEFTVKLDGGLTFKFDNYEGQKCKNDIDEVTALLDECYGVKLSNQKILWSNPDRIQKGSKDNPAGGEARKMHQ